MEKIQSAAPAFYNNSCIEHYRILSVLPTVLSVFEHFRILTHIHFSSFMLWFVLVIIQPMLIRQHRYTLHRVLGKASYFLAPVLVFSILLMIKESVPRNLVISIEKAATGAAGAFLDAIFFSVRYIIAILKKNNTRWHVAFIIGATLIILNPGLGRLLGHLTGQAKIAVLPGYGADPVPGIMGYFIDRKDKAQKKHTGKALTWSFPSFGQQRSFYS